MKKIIALLTAVLMFTCAASVFAADEITVNVNGEAVEFDVQPTVEDGILLLPFRFIAEKLGGNVQWFEDNSENISIRQVLCQIGEDICIMQIGNSNIFVNSSPVALEKAPEIYVNRTLVTAEAIESITGAAVTWNEEEGTVDIVK